MSCLINDNQKLTLLLEPTNQYEFNLLHTVNYNSILYCGGLGTMKKEWHTYVDTTVDSNDYKISGSREMATTNSVGSDAFTLWRT